MAEHWCLEHGVKFFKTPKMKGYAHPIEGVEDENGKTVWCNEEETGEAPKSPPKPAYKPQGKVYKADPDKTGSIETQVAFKGLIDLIVADKIKPDSKEAKATILWAINRLNTFTAEEKTAPKVEVPEQPKDKATQAQIKEFFAKAKELDYPNDLLMAILMREFHVSSTSALTPKQIGQFKNILETGKYKDGVPEEPPVEDSPF